MQRENERSCYKKSLSSPNVSIGDLQRARRFVMKQQTTCVEDSRLRPSGMTGLFYHGNNAFTLIELLVVVLIIGILAVVALSQYEKAVWKSRTSNMQTLVRSVATAQNAYFLANNTYATSFDELPLGFDNFTAGTVLNGNFLDSIHNNSLELRLYQSGNASVFLSGKYKGCGVYVDYKTNQWHCWEWYAYYRGTAEDFCQKVMKAGAMVEESGGVRKYAM